MAETNNGKGSSFVQDELYSYDSFGEKKQPSDSRFLWWCAEELIKNY